MQCLCRTVLKQTVCSKMLVTPKWICSNSLTFKQPGSINCSYKPTTTTAAVTTRISIRAAYIFSFIPFQPEQASWVINKRSNNNKNNDNNNSNNSNNNNESKMAFSRTFWTRTTPTDQSLPSWPLPLCHFLFIFLFLCFCYCSFFFVFVFCSLACENLYDLLKLHIN